MCTLIVACRENKMTYPMTCREGRIYSSHDLALRIYKVIYVAGDISATSPLKCDYPCQQKAHPDQPLVLQEYFCSKSLEDDRSQYERPRLGPVPSKMAKNTNSDHVRQLLQIHPIMFGALEENCANAEWETMVAVGDVFQLPPESADLAAPDYALNCTLWGTTFSAGRVEISWVFLANRA
ncbi:hypothetical protein AG1IA_09917 [Rhizoctonia solani AG-1 IA]|uniref:Uncharacterized protein n=1 Tax=Thanatephorus cucumeris (strain AG1-IA) TaxID=983506 RepID=L8WGZ7_THACA|nr:hypothetical protein AG1IA_09917 [Rhizoctonia solani AG-1 IA]